MAWTPSATFSNESLIKRINIDLANDLGNLVSRTTAMAVKYFGGTLPAEQQADEEKDAELIALASGLKAKYYEKMEAYTFQGALVDIFEVISRANKYIDENAPWVLAKNDEDKPRLARVLYNLLEAVRICTIMLTPFMPDTTAKVFEQIGAEKTGWEDAGTWGLLPADVTVHKGENLFPRLDMDKALEELEDMSGAKVGDKTMMDALIPASEAVAAYTGDSADELFDAAAQAAAQGAEATKQYVSKFGRAKSYGTKTIGTPDAGAVSMSWFFQGLARE